MIKESPAFSTLRTRSSYPASRKRYFPGDHADMRVPYREITLSATHHTGRSEENITFETLDENLLQKPKNWIDTSGFEFVQGESLGAAPNKPVLEAQPEVLDLREKLGGLPKPPAELNELLALLKTGKAPQRDSGAKGFLRFSYRGIPDSVREWFRTLASL